MSVRKEDVIEPAIDDVSNVQRYGEACLCHTILHGLRSRSDNVVDSQIDRIVLIEHHYMVLAFSHILFRMFYIAIDLLLTRHPYPPDHLEGV